MRKLVARHLAKLRQERLRDRLASSAHPPAAPVSITALRAVRSVRVPQSAPDWYFEQELRRSGLWAMMEACYPTRRAQCQ